MSVMIAHVLIWLSVGLTCYCCVATLLMPSSFERLHFMAPVAALAPLLLAGAVALTTGLGQGVVKLLLAMLLLVLTNSVLSHATARAARIRQDNTWMPAEEDSVEKE